MRGRGEGAGVGAAACCAHVRARERNPLSVQGAVGARCVSELWVVEGARGRRVGKVLRRRVQACVRGTRPPGQDGRGGRG